MLPLGTKVRITFTGSVTEGSENLSAWELKWASDSEWRVQIRIVLGVLLRSMCPPPPSPLKKQASSLSLWNTQPWVLSKLPEWLGGALSLDCFCVLEEGNLGQKSYTPGPHPPAITQRHLLSGASTLYSKTCHPGLPEKRIQAKC